MQTRTTARQYRRRRGFTLLELLVAMVILSVVVYSTASIFNQMTVSWDSGTRKAELNMTGRAVVDFMAQEISQAVYDGGILDVAAFPPPGGSSPTVEFITLEESPRSNRIARVIKYQNVGNVIRRTMKICDPDEDYTNISSKAVAVPASDLAPSIQNVEFWSPPAWSDGNPLPPFVDIRVRVQRTEDVKRFEMTNAYYEARAYLYNRNRYRYE